MKLHKDKYDVVITTFAPMSSHMLGHYMKKRGFCKIWIADFRDPMTHLNPRSVIAMMVKKYGSHLLNNVDYITCVSRGAADKVLAETKGNHNDLSRRMRIIPNGFDLADRRIVQHIETIDDKLVFSYCGTVYMVDGKLKTDISPLFQSLHELIKIGKIDKRRLEIRYAGYDSERFKEMAEKFSVDDLVKYYGRISRDQSLQLQRQSDVVVVPVWNNTGEEGIMSGKFFETLLVERNVLCIVTGNLAGSELAAVVRETGCGYAYEEINGDKKGMPALEEWILKIYEEKMKKKSVPYASKNANKFSHQALAEKFATLFD